jgi:hypothetical protein
MSYIQKLQLGNKLDPDYWKRKMKKNFYEGIDPNLGYQDLKQGAAHALNVLSGVKAEKRDEPVADAAWRKRLGMDYNKKLLPDNPDGSVRLPKEYEAQMQADTTDIKNKIRINSKKTDRASKYITSVDQKYLDDLRRMFKDRDTISVGEVAG